MICREIISKIDKFVKNKEIIAIVGARQIGKTTLLNYYFEKLNKKESVFISFENLDDLNLFEDDINVFIKKYVYGKKYLFIDEIQYSKNSGQRLKYIYDTQNIKIFISGSSKSEIAINSLKFLVGRVLIFDMFPLSFSEFIKYKSSENYFIFDELVKQKSCKSLIGNYFEEYLKFGGYPKIVLENDYDKKIELIKNIVNTYLLKEVRDILRYEKLKEFETILKRFSIEDGGILNKSNISQNSDIKTFELNKIISILEKTTILNVVKPFLKNKIKEQIKSSKTYLFDLGFKNSIIKNFNDIDLKKDKGEVYESFILNSLIKNGLEVKYFNEQNRYEIDFIVEINGEIFGFEVKSKLQNSKITNSIKRFCDTFNPKIIFVLNENIDDKIKYNKSEVIFTNYINIFYIIKKILKIK